MFVCPHGKFCKVLISEVKSRSSYDDATLATRTKPVTQVLRKPVPVTSITSCWGDYPDKKPLLWGKKNIQLLRSPWRRLGTAPQKSNKTLEERSLPISGMKNDRFYLYIYLIFFRPSILLKRSRRLGDSRHICEPLVRKRSMCCSENPGRDELGRQSVR